MANDLWDRAILLTGIPLHKRLLDSTVGVVGCGSLCSKIANNLAEGGVGKFILIDPDIVKLVNIPRSAYKHRHLGMPKAIATGEVIRDTNPKAKITTIIP